METDDLTHDDNQQVCHNHGGFLPEPRDEGENQFLDSLDTEMFLLGMTDRDVEGQWIWQTDGSIVTWFRWVQWTDRSQPPNGGSQQNCALMLRGQGSEFSGHTTDSWADYTCGSDNYFRSRPKSLVCQRNPGMWELSVTRVVNNFLHII